MRVLVIDDAPKAARWLARALEEAGYAVDVAAGAFLGQALAQTVAYDLVIVDVGLLDGGALGVVHALRGAGRTMPILILTGVGDDERIVAALDAGADDILVEPISNGVLQARVRAALRRGGAVRTEQIVVGDLTLDRLRRSVKAGGQVLDLSPREFALLEDLMLRPEATISRTDLLERVWGMRFDAGTNVVDATISRLRQKVAAAVSNPRIRTVRGVGFVLRTTG